MAKSERMRGALAQADAELRDDPTMRLLQERMAYHRGKMAEERTRAERSAAMPTWRRLLPF